MSKSKGSPVTERERQYIAWREVWSRLYKETEWVWWLVRKIALLVGAAWLLEKAGHWVNENDYWLEAGLFVGMVLAIFLVDRLFQYYGKVYRELYGRAPSIWRTDGWRMNKGQHPGYARVSIERQSGAIRWNVLSDELDWSLDSEDPISEYLPK